MQFPVLPLLLGWIAAIGTVCTLLHNLRDLRKSHPFLNALVFAGFLFPIALIFCLPMDVSTARFLYCRLSSKHPGTQCKATVFVVDQGALRWTWRMAFWVGQACCWIILPLIQGFVESGHFSFQRRLLDSLVINVLLLLGLSVGVSLLIAYLLAKGSSLAAVEGLLMAASNTAGLLFVVLFMGHGLVEVPRWLWRCGDQRKQLKRLEFAAPQVREEMLEASAVLDALYNVLHLGLICQEIRSLTTRQEDEGGEYEEYIQLLLQKTPSNGADHPGNHPLITMDYLVGLNRQLKEAQSKREQTQVAWTNLVVSARHILHRNHHDRQSGVLIRGLAMCAGVLSCMIVLSEVSLCAKSVDLGVISWLNHSHSGLFVDCIAYLTFGYMACCCYSSFMSLRILHWYKLMLDKHTDEKSLVLFSAMFCRFIFPLGYNYLCLIEGGGGGRDNSQRVLMTEFSRVMGQIDLVPLLGRSFALYVVPGSLVLVCVIVATNCHRVLFSLLKVDMEGWPRGWGDAEQRNSRLAEGRALILTNHPGGAHDRHQRGGHRVGH